MGTEKLIGSIVESLEELADLRILLNENPGCATTDRALRFNHVELEVMIYQLLNLKKEEPEVPTHIADLTIPIVHLNGTSEDELIEQRKKVYQALRVVLEALCKMSPHGRDYYPEPGLLDRAKVQHLRRVETINRLMAEMVAETAAIADGASSTE
jgi:hypothetical protein